MNAIPCTFGEEAFATAETVYKSMLDLRELKGYLPKRPTALIIGTHGPDMRGTLLPSDVVLREDRSFLHGSGDVVEQVLHQLAHQGRQQYNMIIGLYELHHLNPDHLPAIMESISRITTHVHIFADYTLRSVSDESARASITGGNERKMIDRYGSLENWLDSHRTFEGTEITHSIASSSFDSAAQMRLSQTRLMAMGAHDLNHRELQALMPSTATIIK